MKLLNKQFIGYKLQNNLQLLFSPHNDFNNIVLPILAVNLMRNITLPLPSIAELPDDDETPPSAYKSPTVEDDSGSMAEREQLILSQLVNSFETRSSAYERIMGKSKKEALKYYSQNYRRLQQSKRERLVLKKMEKLLTSQWIVDEIQEQERQQQQFSTDEETYLSQASIPEQIQPMHQQNDTCFSLDLVISQQSINNSIPQPSSPPTPYFPISFLSIMEQMSLILLDKLGILNTKTSNQMLHLQLKQSREYLFENRAILERKFKLFIQTIQSNHFFLQQLKNKNLTNLVQSFRLRSTKRQQHYNSLQMSKR